MDIDKQINILEDWTQREKVVAANDWVEVEKNNHRDGEICWIWWMMHMIALFRFLKFPLFTNFFFSFSNASVFFSCRNKFAKEEAMKRLSAAIRLCWLAAVISQIYAEVSDHFIITLSSCYPFYVIPFFSDNDYHKKIILNSWRN